jgi:YbgC/YbaW family acyl-CoA thioester hydrolase
MGRDQRGQAIPGHRATDDRGGVLTPQHPGPIAEFTYRRRVQFPETDASGIVHFTNFFKYVEEAEHAMWRAAGLSIAGHDSTVGWPRIAASFEYRRPLRFEDEFEVHIEVAEITHKTIRYRAVVRHESGVVAEGSLKIICVRRRPGESPRAMDIPPDIRSRFTEKAPEPA